MRKAILFIVILLLIVASVGTIRQSNKSNLEVNLKKVELQDNASKLKKLESDYSKINGKNAQTEQQVKDLEQKRLQLEKEKADLEAQLQAKAELKANQAKVYAASLPTVPFTQRALSGNAAKDFIYSHESGNRTDAINPNGACGLGQALPCSKMGCSLQDYACQDAFFTGYMQSRYGSWEAAMAFWQVHSWW